MSAATKENIIRVGAEIIHRKGFNNTGIQEILTAANVPKGSFYFYFKNKDDFGMHVIDYFISESKEMGRAILSDTSLPPLERLKQFWDQTCDFLVSKECTCGCPIGNLSQELGDLNPVFREKLMLVTEEMSEPYIHILTEAQQRGDISTSLDVKETAFFLTSCWQGAMIQMKVAGNLAPLRRCARFLFEYILK